MKTTSTRVLAAATAAMMALFPAVAGAGESSEDVTRTAVLESSRSPLSSGNSLDLLVDAIDAAGSSENVVGGLTRNSDFPIALDPDIGALSQPAVVKIDDSHRPGVQRWHVASPAMSRVVELQVVPAKDLDRPAPMLYLLDGVDAAADSEWMTEAQVHRRFADEHVTLVMPTEAPASLYLDWYADDPALGRNKWETFLVEELPPLLENHQAFHHNGKRGIGGLSMGAFGAVTLANRNPEVYDAVFGISGCYSTTSQIGEIMVRNIVETRGGSLENLYGPAELGRRAAHDVQSDPSGLRDMAVYLSASQGAASAADKEFFSPYGPDVALYAMVLEQGSHSCTMDFNAALHDAGLDHQKVEIQREGMHFWPTFNEAIKPAWRHVEPALS
ncbi:MAG: alpha/beta hydrolase family protein [Corynebacterium sp.]|uniref:alpha/beta hydrolase n=1 Tax=Corynebacterium sp. TaxID=1720 RepID=UPI0026F9D21D|nr:alpha/beta hydrolase family protein [Corynebacterium sp.]